MIRFLVQIYSKRQGRMEKLCEQIKDYKNDAGIFQKRIRELEAKITRKVVLLEYWFLYVTENYSLRL